MPLHLKERWHAYTELWQPLSYAYLYLLQDLSKGVQDIRGRTFAKWYSTLGHHFAAYEAEATPVPRLVGKADGTVLELGPGSGNQFPRFNQTTITQIYGVEPNEQLCRQLQTRTITKHGLDNIYVLIHAAFEDDSVLESHGIADETVDTIVCMQVLCSLRNPADAARKMHRLLKPGGKLLFWEHQASRDTFTRLVQACWNLLWTPLIGGCSLRADVEQALFNSGDWDIVELGHDNEQPWSLMPRVWGHFVKKGNNDEYRRSNHRLPGP